MRLFFGPFPLCSLSVFSQRETDQHQNTNPKHRPQQTKPQHGGSRAHHQSSSQEGIIDLVLAQPAQPVFANTQQRTEAINQFYHIVKDFEAAEPKPPGYNKKSYNRPALIRLAFFQCLMLGMADGDGDINLNNDLCSLLFAFAEDLVHNFFLPCNIYTFSFLFIY
ncbi:hypothetical protein B0T25DRAFT_528957 [Lasiosphaeria hispida]|uniref:Uncharacterized protein n=1 Tax=Lasiosphaeria hispida TaxID=260671 RepID=A0AAJ0MKN9_9PEZI|nr:hypothetical protein B0T25DRAFT_528957 [Lasiosphaeria hispida]